MYWQKPRLRIVVLAVIVLVVFIVTPACLRLYKPTGTSAAPSMLLGDEQIVNRAAYHLMPPYSRVG